MSAVNLSEKMLAGEDFTREEKISIVAKLSIPGILAQISDIIMQYIDAAMVGALGAAASASIGLSAAPSWLMFGFIGSAAAGFSVQTAHAVGAGDNDRASSIFRQSVAVTFLLSAAIGLLGILIAPHLPKWLGAEESLWRDTSLYLGCFCLFLPLRQLNRLAANMLQCTGDMKTPSILLSLMCLLDVIFNFVLIFPGRTLELGGLNLFIPGAGLGVLGAQLGTSLASAVIGIVMFYQAAVRSEILSFRIHKGSWRAEKEVLAEACRIGVPMTLENTALSLAQIVSTMIIAPLGTVAIAAHSFAITAESICYMPGFGVSTASTAMVGQAIGARREDLARSFAWITVWTGVLVMTCTGAAMYVLCPYVFAFMTPVEEVRALGVHVLRYELLAEPLFAASIVATGALRGAGDTLIPGLINLFSIWCIRLPLAYILTKSIGLSGVWIAMAIEIGCRGIFFLIRLKLERWLPSKAKKA